MSGDDIARMAYLGLLAVAIAGYYFAQNRESLGRTAQYAAVWGLIFVGVIAAVGLWSDIRRAAAPGQVALAEGEVAVPRSRDGHFHLTLEVNGTPVDFIVDTGASQIVLSTADAARVGLDPESLAYLGSAQTANGIVRTASVRLGSVVLEGQTDLDVRAVVNQGDIDGSLLGMTYLDRFARIVIEGDRLLLTR